MADTIFINYRREDSIGTAGRLHDRLTQTFGQNNVFMDVDSIPAGIDFAADLNREVAQCDVVLVVIGPEWLNAKDESGGRRLDNPDDFVVIEIAAALTRDIPVIPVLVDGARIPKVSELPDAIKPLARRNAVEVRNAQFGRDAQSLIEKIQGPLIGGPTLRRPWRGKALAGGAALLIIGVGSYVLFQQGMQRGLLKTDLTNLTNLTPTLQALTHNMQTTDTVEVRVAEPSQIVAEAEAKRKADEAERQRVGAGEKEREQTQAEARYYALINRANTEAHAGDYDRAITTFSEAIRLDPTNALAFRSQGDAYVNKGDPDQAIADFNEAIRLDPKDTNVLGKRGLAYLRTSDLDRAIADFNEVIQLKPNNASAFNNRGVAYLRKKDYGQAISDFSEAIRLNPNYAVAFCNRGLAKERSNNGSSDDDKSIARQLDASACR